MQALSVLPCCTKKRVCEVSNPPLTVIGRLNGPSGVSVLALYTRSLRRVSLVGYSESLMRPLGVRLMGFA